MDFILYFIKVLFYGFICFCLSTIIFQYFFLLVALIFNDKDFKKSVNTKEKKLAYIIPFGLLYYFYIIIRDWYNER